MAFASVALAVVLLLAKGWAAVVTDSTAMLGSLMVPEMMKLNTMVRAKCHYECTAGAPSCSHG